MKSVLPEGFRVNGTLLPSGNVPQAVIKAIAVLDKLPFKELVTTRQLAAMINYAMNTVQQYGADPHLEHYRFMMPQGRSMAFWGSKRTIKELKRQNEKAAKL